MIHAHYHVPQPGPTSSGSCFYLWYHFIPLSLSPGPSLIIKKYLIYVTASEPLHQLFCLKYSLLILAWLHGWILLIHQVLSSDFFQRLLTSCCEFIWYTFSSVGDTFLRIHPAEFQDSVGHKTCLVWDLGGGRKVARSRFLLYLKGRSRANMVAAHPRCCLSAGSSSWPWANRQARRNTTSCWIAAFSCCDSWARCVLYSVTRMPGSARQPRCWGWRLGDRLVWVPFHPHAFYSSWPVPMCPCSPHFTAIFPSHLPDTKRTASNNFCNKSLK